MHAEGQQFDVVILDPPAFIQRKKDLKKGFAAYRRINELGLRLLAPVDCWSPVPVPCTCAGLI